MRVWGAFFKYEHACQIHIHRSTNANIIAQNEEDKKADEACKDACIYYRLNRTDRHSNS